MCECEISAVFDKDLPIYNKNNCYSLHFPLPVVTSNNSFQFTTGDNHFLRNQVFLKTTTKAIV